MTLYPPLGATFAQNLRDDMKPHPSFRPIALSTSLLCLGGWLAFAPVSEAQTLFSRPVGVMQFTVNAGESKPLSLPVSETYLFGGAVSFVSAASITNTGANWGANAFGPIATNPHLVRFTTGSATGRHYRIASHTADTLTLQTNGTDLTSLVVATDRFEIVPADTLAGLFGANAGAAGVTTGTNSQTVDNVLVRGTSGWLTYYNDGTNWLRAGSSGSQNNTIIPPESGFVFVRRGATPFNFTLSGEAPITNLVTELPAGRTVLGANRFPVDTTLNALGLHTTPGWLKGSDANAVDNVLISAGGTWQTYFHDNTNWLLVGNAAPQNPTIAAGSSIIIVKRPGSTATVNQVRPYSLQ